MSFLYDLRACPLFFELYDEEISKVLKKCHFVSHSPGETVDSGGVNGLVVLLRGEGDILLSEKNGSLNYRSLGAYCVAYEKMFDTAFSRRCEIKARLASEFMIVPTDELFRLYRQDPVNYGVLLTNLINIMFRDSGSANGLIARLFFSDAVKMRVPVYSAAQRKVWEKKPVSQI